MLALRAAVNPTNRHVRPGGHFWSVLGPFLGYPFGLKEAPGGGSEIDRKKHRTLSAFCGATRSGGA